MQLAVGWWWGSEVRRTWCRLCSQRADPAKRRGCPHMTMWEGCLQQHSTRCVFVRGWTQQLHSARGRDGPMCVESAWQGVLGYESGWADALRVLGALHSRQCFASLGAARVHCSAVQLWLWVDNAYLGAGSRHCCVCMPGNGPLVADSAEFGMGGQLRRARPTWGFSRNVHGSPSCAASGGRWGPCSTQHSSRHSGRCSASCWQQVGGGVTGQRYRAGMQAAERGDAESCNQQLLSVHVNCSCLMCTACLRHDCGRCILPPK
jgi:hypothetical protein